MINHVPSTLMFQVEEGGQQKLTSHDISVSDQDSKVSQLSIILDAPPTFGAIHSNKAGKF